MYNAGQVDLQGWGSCVKDYLLKDLILPLTKEKKKLITSRSSNLIYLSCFSALY